MEFLRIPRRLSRPIYLQQIINLLHSINSSHRFLGHLLLKERCHIALEHNPPLLGLNPNLMARNMRVGRQGVVNAFEQRAAKSGGVHSVDWWARAKAGWERQGSH